MSAWDGADEQTTAASIEKTARWEQRSKDAHKEKINLFGIVQGVLSQTT